MTTGTAPDGGSAAPASEPLGRLYRWLPRGTTLPDVVWRRRHLAILVVLWLHVPGLFLFGITTESALHSAIESGFVAAFAIAATLMRRQWRLGTVMAALGLFTSSAVLVHLSGGFIEMHFHYFVMVGVVTLYQDWRPFLVAIGYVILQHGLAGAMAPGSAYNHPAAVGQPLAWAGIHGLFILAMSAAGIASWRLNESLVEAVQQREEKLWEAQEVARLGSWEWEVPTGRMTWSEELYRLMGVTPGELTPSYDAFFARVDPADREQFSAEVQSAVEQGRSFAFDFRTVLSGGPVRWLHARGQVTARTGDRAVVYSGTVQDITDRKQLEDELAHQAFHDSLTNLANQALFRNRVEHALARAARRGSGLAVAFLDLDNFKTVNDSLGHRAGDDLLVQVANRLQGQLRDEDTTARLGGDEFAVLLEDMVNRQDAMKLADRLIAALSLPFEFPGREVFVGASIGIAFYDHELTTDQLLRNADLAMYTAKAAGKGRARVFETGMHTAAVERLDLEADLRRALDRGELEVHYQPIVALDTGTITSVEALVRWHHPERGVLSPATFVPLAEETGLVNELGRQVLYQATAQVRRWQLTHPYAETLAVSVNLSPRQLVHAGLVDQVRQALEMSGLPASALVLEITEGAMMRDTETTMARLQGLKDLGVRLAIDDFGTGYSSLSYLQRFPVDIVKIDRSFVTALGTGDDGASLPGAIVSMAQNLRLEVVAEGVETPGQLELLSQLGCDLVQGYHLARPGDPARVERLLGHRLPPADDEQRTLVPAPAPV